MKKWNCIVINPPYQTTSENGKQSHPLWHKFIDKTINDLLKDDGYLCAVHPSGWRNVSGRFNETKKLMLSQNIKHLEMYDKEQGIKTFGARTMYDWYVLQKSSPNGTTTIRNQDGTFSEVDLSKLPFVPSGQFDKIISLLAKEGEEKCELLHDAANYHTQKKWMSGKETDTFKFKCVYMVKANEEPVFKYSSVNNRGHFGIPKLMWGNGGYNMGSFIDLNGDYGQTQFAHSIIDDVSRLPLIKQAFDSKDFRELMKCCDGGDSNVNRKVIALFRKDWWKEFV